MRRVRGYVFPHTILILAHDPSSGLWHPQWVLRAFRTELSA